MPQSIPVTALDGTLPRALASSITDERRRRLTRRALPLLGGLAAVALIAGVVVGSGVESQSQRVARDFVEAWQRADHAAMYDLLSSGSQARYGRASFDAAYENAAAVATATRLLAGDPGGESGGRVPVRIEFQTRIFG